MKKNKYIGIALGAGLLAAGMFGCTDLEEDVLGGKFVLDAAGTAPSLESALNGAYAQVNKFSDFGLFWSMQEYSSDELQGPTRGADWGDFGKWRQLHQHNWTPTHENITNSWDELNNGVYRANQVISVAGSDNKIKGEASFLRALFMWNIVDLYGQVPFRETTDSPDANPKVMTRKEATLFVIKDLEFAAANLPSGTFGKASKEAANALLAKVYLNKAVYDQDPASAQGPYTFAKADMDKAVQYANAVISSAKYSVQPKGEYFKMFYWNNTADSKETIYGVDNVAENVQANVRSFTFFTTHYNQAMSGWNGATTLEDFYNGFDKADERIGGTLTGLTDKTGIRTGFLIGQQYNAKGEKLKDRSGNDLIFTPKVNLLFAAEADGIRAIKFPLDPANTDNSPNDLVILRYSDILLVKAEAILRGGTDPMGDTPVKLVNMIRANRSLPELTTVDVKGLLAERGHELYWEGWRRQDQIRFGTFLQPMDNKSNVSPDYAVLFCLPQKAVDTNPNLKQNRGY